MSSKYRGAEGSRVALLSVRQVAQLLGVSTALVYRLCERGELAHFRVSIEFADIREYWRFYQSGQFVHFWGLRSDWREQVPVGKFVDIEDVTFRLFEVFAFAGRLAATPAGTPAMSMRLRFVGLSGRRLDVGPERVPFISPKVASVPEFTYERELSRSSLEANPHDLAITAAKELFRRFSWDPPTETLMSSIERIRRLRS